MKHTQGPEMGEGLAQAHTDASDRAQASDYLHPRLHKWKWGRVLVCMTLSEEGSVTHSNRNEEPTQGITGRQGMCLSSVLVSCSEPLSGVAEVCLSVPDLGLTCLISTTRGWIVNEGEISIV